MLTLLLPEISVLLLAVLFLFISIGKGRAGASFPLLRAASLVPFALSFVCICDKGVLFNGAYNIDLFSQVFKVMLSFGICMILFMVDKTDDIAEGYTAEYFMFLAFSVLGLMMLVSSVELISIVISLEISSYSLYVVVPLRRGQSKTQWEAAVKYLFFGAISTGVMLYGMSYIYAICQSTYLVDIARILP